MKMKKGRNKKYSTDEIRNEVRKTQNRINQRRCRLKGKTIQSIGVGSKTTIKDYYNFFNQYQFNYFLTGTHILDKSNNIHSLRKYTTAYIEHLYNEGKIERGLMTIEGGVDKNIHTHILLQTTAELESSVYLGFSLLKGGMNIIEFSPLDKERYISYCFKEVHLNPKTRNDLDKLDYWNVFGDWGKPH